MPISSKVADFMQRGSWIRRMFEEGRILKTDGKGPVYDFTLGNPELEPPEAFTKALIKAVTEKTPGGHRYMTNPGYPETRSAVAKTLSMETGLEFRENLILMTVGTAGALNTLLKALISPGEEVIILSPYFVEYLFYIDNHEGKCIIAPTNEDFTLNLEEIIKRITEKTRAIIINNPCNPTGIVHSQSSLNDLGEALRERSRFYRKEIYLIDDGAYRRLIYDLPSCPTIFKSYEHSILVTSHSKDLGLPGERIGYVALSPKAVDADKLFDAMAFTIRTLGFINAPALMQRVVKDLQNVCIDIKWYQRKRDILTRELTRMGYSVVKPQGAFYIFPKSPVPDDLYFVRELKNRRVLVVPGAGFGRSGYFRIAYCVEDKVVEDALPIFEEVIKNIK